MPTIYDIAKAAQVSPKTVSRVINSDAPVRLETRQQVEQAMNELGYVPSKAARSMRSNRSGIVGLITGAVSQSSEISEPHGLPDLFIVQGIQRVLADEEITLMIADTGGLAKRIPTLINTFLQYRVEGLIYVADRHQRISLPPLPQGQQMILVNCFDDQGTPAIVPDDQKGQRDLVLTLIKEGHRRIAYLCLHECIATELRIAGYRKALETAGLPFDLGLVQCGDFERCEEEPQLQWQIIQSWLALPDPPTVICCGNDEMAMRIYGVLRTQGMAVPEAISIAGYDNHRSIAETLYPALTTMELPYESMGIAAAQRLIQLIRNEPNETPTLQRIRGDVFWRSSVIARP
ncbi:MAG: LacI family DNA-binding transcriptional regulator [bacterium]